MKNRNYQKIAWSGLADKDYYEHIAKYCLPSWKNLPGDRFLVTDTDIITVPDIKYIQWDTVVNKDAQFPLICKKSKPLNFWRKMQSQVWALRNLRDYDWIILLDTDIEIYQFNLDYFGKLLKSIDKSRLVWATGESHKGGLDAGHIIVNMNHSDLDRMIDYYENIWESGKIFELERFYDGHAVESMFDVFPSYKIPNIDHGGGFHTYILGTVHYGSKLPKALRAVWPGTTEDLIKGYIERRFELAEQFQIKGKL
jgi:hypothetical protein